MQITQKFVDLANVRFRELTDEIKAFSTIEGLIEREVKGSESVKKEMLKMLSDKLGKVTEVDEVVEKFHQLEGKLKMFVQLDRLAKDLSALKGVEGLQAELEKVKMENKDELLKALEIDEEELEA